MRISNKFFLGRLLGGSLILNCLLFFSAFGQSQKIKIKTTHEGGYVLYVKGKPFMIKGVSYNPVPIGQGYEYDIFSDENKPWLVDGKLMKESGINCVRIYTTGSDLEKTKEFIRDMHKKFGIYTIIGDWLGLWSSPPANYTDEEFRKKTEERLLKTVEALKDEEGLLMWVLGNENNYTFSGNVVFWTSPEIEKISTPSEQIAKRAEIYYSFVNELAEEIKQVDSFHPIALGNGEATFLDIASKYCKNTDVLAVISYRGKKFGNLFNNIRSFFDKPIFISEFGCDSYDVYKEEENQDIQAQFLLSQWEDLYKNTVFSSNKEGNCLGGVIFEWSDEWWKHNEGYAPDWNTHNKEAGWSNGSYYYDIRGEDNLNMNEEWFGLVSLNEEIDKGINKRIPKKSFYEMKRFFSHLPSKISKKITLSR